MRARGRDDGAGDDKLCGALLAIMPGRPCKKTAHLLIETTRAPAGKIAAAANDHHRPTATVPQIRRGRQPPGGRKPGFLPLHSSTIITTIQYDVNSNAKTLSAQNGLARSTAPS